MQIHIGARIEAGLQPGLRDQARLVLGSHVQALQRLQLDRRDGRLVLQAGLVDGRQLCFDTTDGPLEGAAHQLLQRLRRRLQGALVHGR